MYELIVEYLDVINFPVQIIQRKACISLNSETFVK
jgi:hypothetical protein